ncbi:helix-turn-helix transcriptional regulator [Micromonospora sp. Llam7]|uniref:AraC family transcriptional regulator n=1 Tax=Micromonospora tarapacensis TaxID=2835305 RepID=UPI001C82B752|nr:AraC family transcriptional regulator [Micromonospora tarapacensis]MBX7265784.1 helix-turn-helix transcriptional regulator [Micromonospora tarapacensis]
MRSVMRLVDCGEFSVDDVRIRADRRAWFPPEVHTDYRLVFVRSGLFRLRVGDWDLVADPMLAYIARPGDEQQIAHRVDVTDMCTSITFSAPLLRDVVGTDGLGTTRPMVTTGRIDLLHRLLVSRARAGTDEFELHERVSQLLYAMLDPSRQPSPPATVPSTITVRRLVDGARELLTDDPVSLSLRDLARELHSSPPYLSRVFHRNVGMSLTRFRNRIRVCRVLEQIEAGEQGLAKIAIELGFADHAHMTRTVRAECGHPPAAFRRMLTSAAAS